LKLDLSVQGFQYFEDDRLVLTGPISSGTPEHPTPTGRFQVLRKEKHKVSRSYTNALDMPTPMPYSLQFQGPYYVHEGWVPGYPDSHGCVRLHYEDARFLYARMRRGDPILISGSAAGGNWVNPEAAVAADASNAGDWLRTDDPRRAW
jgi:lipoprotein-anchoring transpeptidase ErfK/SrfK